MNLQTGGRQTVFGVRTSFRSACVMSKPWSWETLRESLHPHTKTRMKVLSRLVKGPIRKYM